MDFAKLGSNEKLAIYGSVAVIIGLIAASGLAFGLGTLALLAAIVMLVIVLLPQFSPGTSLPGSKGTFMLIAGVVAAASLVLTLLSFLSFLGALFGSLSGILFLVAVVGSIVMAWAGWNEFQAEGGKFQLGTASARPAAPPPAPDDTPRVTEPTVEAEPTFEAEPRVEAEPGFEADRTVRDEDDRPRA